jgi:hypothetical protein
MILPDFFAMMDSLKYQYEIPKPSILKYSKPAVLKIFKTFGFS